MYQVGAAQAVFRRRQGGQARRFDSLATALALAIATFRQAQAGQAAPGCLRYELRQADGDSDLWLLHSEWSDDAAMQAYLAGDAQRVFAEVLWQALAATLDVQERPF
ncbi:antibiotic biosynthesis monooxygenase [Pseudomonas aeruginosa]|nr:antibiotic biosynthesis monooxygenase [Pseudomonas aeruginosa]